MYQKIIASFLLSLLCFNLYAHEPKAGKILLSIGPAVSQTRLLNAQDSSNNPFNFGLGILGEADTGQSGGFEVGLFFAPKTYERIFGFTHIVEKINKLSIPIGYRYWVLNRVSMAGSFNSVFSVGDYQTVFNDTAIGSGFTSARDITEYGIDLSLQWEIWTKSSLIFVLDGRYFVSLSAKSGEDSNLYSLLLGIKYLIKEN